MKKISAMLIFVLVLSFCAVVSLQTVRGSSEVPISTIESCDSEGFTKNVFSPGEQVYLKVTDEGPGLVPNSDYCVFIVSDHEPWEPYDTDFGDVEIVVGATPNLIWAMTDSSGHFVGEPLLIWESAAPGYYDIWADNHNFVYERFIYDPFSDAIDNFDVGTAGFFVVPEVPLGSITVLLACFAGLVIKRRRLF